MRINGLWSRCRTARRAAIALFFFSAVYGTAAEVLSFTNIQSLVAYGRSTRGQPNEQLKVGGTVTYQHGGYSIFIQDSSGGIYAGFGRDQKVQVGDEVEVVGKLNRSGFSPILSSASAARVGRGALPAPEPMDLQAALQGKYDMRLVRFAGVLSAWHDHGSTVFLTVVTNGVPFHVELTKADPAAAFSWPLLNSMVQLQGVCSVKADRDRTIRSLLILMRSREDLLLLSPPPYWTAARVGYVALGLVAVAAAVLFWVCALRRQVGRKTAEILRLNEELDWKVKTRTKELEAVNRELEAFTYSVSHDLKAPVRAIQGFAGLLAVDHGREISPPGQELLQRIDFNANRMGNLISDLLSFSQASQWRLKIERVDMNTLVQDVLLQFSSDIQSRKIQLRTADLPPVEGDSALLKQALFNLVSNAVKYTRTRECAKIEIGVATQEQERAFFVKDNGIGFAPECAHNLFQPFQRLHSNAEYEGSGVGLAIAHRIITRHGGKLWAEAQSEQGATFYWSLPQRGFRNL
jgi:signal transduction histidine kinase